MDRIDIVSPALQQSNNGNWRTAYRWARFLHRRGRVAIRTDWMPDDEGEKPTDCLIALHARRSAAAIVRFADAHPDRPRILVLTGTDLYRDIQSDVSARRSLDLATHLVVLQEAGVEELAPAHRAKCSVIYQSAPALKPHRPKRKIFDAVLVGHLRAEKDPLTAMRALHHLPADSAVRLVHIGAALDDEHERAARALAACSWPSIQRYRWLGDRPHAETRQRIRHARAMVVSSRMEGGANVIIEAITAGVPVLASRIPGNLGMLGRDYRGYFSPGDERELAGLLDRASRDAAFLEVLRRQCAARAHLFAPERERAEVNALVESALAGPSSAS